MLLNATWLCTKASQAFSGIFSGTLLNLTYSKPFPLIEDDLTLHQSLPDFPRTLFRILVESDLALY
jgi:hypothetical protein